MTPGALVVDLSEADLADGDYRIELYRVTEKEPATSLVLRLRSADREPANPFLTQAQCDGTQAPSLVMLYVQNSRDKARRGDLPRLARHAEMMVAMYAKLLDLSFISRRLFSFLRGGGGWEGP